MGIHPAGKDKSRGHRSDIGGVLVLNDPAAGGRQIQPYCPTEVRERRGRDTPPLLTSTYPHLSSPQLFTSPHLTQPLLTSTSPLLTSPNLHTSVTGMD